MNKNINFKKCILITGGMGFIGSHCCRYFVNNYPNYLIVNFDAMTYAGNPLNVVHLVDCPNFVCVKGDIRNPKDVQVVFEKYQITDVIHLAAESHVDRSLFNPNLFAETNILGTLNLMNMAKVAWNNDPDRHVFFNMGTDEIFGALDEHGKPFNETMPLNPHSPYSASKTAQVMFAKTYYEAFGLPAISMACGNAIGPYQFPEKLVPLTIDRLIHKQNIPIYGEGKQMRDWTNVHDIVYAIDLIFHKGKIGELYCIGGDACKANIDVVHSLLKEYVQYVNENGNTETVEELEKLITFIPDPRGKSHDFRYDIDHSKITIELGWLPRYTFEDSIKMVIEWYCTNAEWLNATKNGEYKNFFKLMYDGKL
nr:MAG TPA: hypothetical protein [Bacteriophage sp.]